MKITGAHGTYAVDKPNGFDASNGSVKALVYNTGALAAAPYAGNGYARLIYMSFPLDKVYPLPYAGRSVKLRFGVGNDSTGGGTGMLIDDVRAQVCTR